MILFFKAVKTKSVHQSSLFDQVDPVKGYTRKDGVFIAPHQAKHKHALKPAPAQKPAINLVPEQKPVIKPVPEQKPEKTNEIKPVMIRPAPTSVMPNPESEKESVDLYRAGVLADTRGTGIFLSKYKQMAMQYLRSGNELRELHHYKLKPNLKLKDAVNRYTLIKELVPTFDGAKALDSLIRAEHRNGGRPIKGMHASGLYQTNIEKKIRIELKKQGFHGVRYAGSASDDQGGEYQIFDANNLIEQ